MLKFPNIDPVAINILDIIKIRWYSLSYIAGVLLGRMYIRRLIITKKTKLISLEDLDEYITYFVFGLIIGGRVFYCFFYQPQYYINNPIDILKTYEGGMSFHGGLIGVFCSSYIFCKKKNINLLSLADLISLVAPIGIFFGRIANFINAELYGRYTNVPWGVIFPYDALARHPSQIYEAATEGIIILIINVILSKYTNILVYNGKLFANFLILYSIFRFFNEFFREYDFTVDLLLFKLTAGQTLSLVLFFIGVLILFKLNKKNA